ncbi:hypothetical protein [Bradyrhizobium sp. WYCCWR 12699]|uniref:hypothetical protein n=1 Tax=Bradyrhizobium sp. WYCCWR 12699 TaxID=3064203 RepID=UPI0028A4DF8D|nr:hypothetical protein [Bradyrhizobium sp. WYCCWR 12699]MDT4743672.1 hypothetical protein [Bradyrhizobium sp. WYCCWR 12699]
MTKRNNAERASDKRIDSSLRALRARYRLFPLDFFLEELNDFRRGPNFRRDMAKAAAAYLHPRFTPVLVIQATGESEFVIDVKRLTDHELEQLDQILARGQVPAADVAEE